MMHKPSASPARRDKLKKLFSYIEILIKTHELSTIHKYFSIISRSTDVKQIIKKKEEEEEETMK